MHLLLHTNIYSQQMLKRFFDLIASSIALMLFFWLIFIAWLIASYETKSNGFFIQKRVGRHGKIFNIIKIKTMYPDNTGKRSSISTSSMSGITRSGRIMRRLKIDELPQLWNVLVGQMSFVGPRPDVPGYADKLIGNDRLVLELRPGITGPASIKYKKEEEILSKANNPKQYNDEVIWPDKVRLNLDYYHTHSLKLDLHYIVKSIKS